METDNNSTTENRKSLKLLSYNIDGLNDSIEDLRERCMYQISLIISENPDVIHLQEVTPSIVPILVSAICRCGYQCSDNFSSSLAYSIGNYFILSFVKSSLRNISFQRVPFAGKDDQSVQGREMLFTSFVFNGHDFLLINSHLESCGTAFRSKESSTRLAQLETCLSSISSHYPRGPALIAGDLNIRDSEASYKLKQFPSIIDMAETFSKSSGKPKECTWIMPNKPSVKLRFDRCYYNSHPSFQLENFALIGTEDVLDESSRCGYLTPSDHYGIVITIKEIVDSEKEMCLTEENTIELSKLTKRSQTVVENATSSENNTLDNETITHEGNQDISHSRKKFKSSKETIIDLTTD